ncbi:FecCD family ABC transporter permease [Novispirillum itersonii]|uniref:Iron complex transport system permease protein n=1 Tax=Novispirillum itersonii TaxID=189 RepID=A0A7W9ZJ52_NOVIT|nr:iron ABC transporter permease [Novispirillum itersonii]MBB6211119.1 iron complex transport system permease protein [Novispirillum itersonii]
MNAGGQADAAVMQAIAGHDRLIRRRLAVIGGLACLVLAGVVLDMGTGPAGVSLREVVEILSFRHSGDTALQVIVWQVRLPTALLAVLVGASLSLAGAEMQTILDNPLASPFTLGVSSAAAFGAALAIVMGITVPMVPKGVAVSVNAFVAAFASVLLIQLFARLRGSSSALVLFGIALVFGFNALVAVIQFVAPTDSLQQLVFWTMGSLSGADTASVTVLAVLLAATFPFSLRAAWPMTLLALGEERAQSLGVHPERLRFACLLRASLLASLAVACAGTIGFVGLIGPHVARLLVGQDHRYFLPSSLLAGAAILSFSSVVAKVILPGVLLPIGIVTSLVGLPCFIALLMMGRGGK